MGNESIEGATSLAEIAADTLEDAYRTDPAAINTLVGLRRECNRALADHPYVVVHVQPLPDNTERFWVGMLGVLNGVLAAAGEVDRVAAKVDDQGNVVGFTVVDGDPRIRSAAGG